MGVPQGEGVEVLRVDDVGVPQGEGVEVLQVDDVGVPQGEGVEVLRVDDVGVPQGEGVEVLQVEEVGVPHSQDYNIVQGRLEWARVAAKVEVGEGLQQHACSLYEQLQRKKTQKSTKWSLARFGHPTG